MCKDLRIEDTVTLSLIYVHLCMYSLSRDVLGIIKSRMIMRNIRIRAFESFKNQAASVLYDVIYYNMICKRIEVDLLL